MTSKTRSAAGASVAGSQNELGEIMLTRRRFIAGASLASVSVHAKRAAAQAYPTQTIRILAGFPAGGGIDLVARLLAEPFKTMGQSVIVENRTGAAGMIAAQTVAKAPPDGHLLLMATSGEIAIAHHLYKEKMTYDPIRELAPVALVGIVPCVVVVAESTPVKTPQELIAYAKANPKKLSFSSSGVGNPQQLAGELMNIMAGTDVLHVPYRGAAPAVADVATGAVTMSFASLAAALPLIEAGKLRAVAVTSLGRMPQLSAVAPLQEGSPGLKGYELLNWFGLFATGGTPEPILTQLNAIANRTLQESKTVELLMKQGIVPRPLSPAEYKSFVAAESEKFAKVIDQARIKPEG
jgi:tripartite-type tricarboxylate transporter receptor subunit TctC